MDHSLVHIAVATALGDMDMLDGHQPETQPLNTVRAVNEVVVEELDKDEEMINSKELPDGSDQAEDEEAAEDSDDESDVELLEIQTYEQEPDPAPATTKKAQKQSKASAKATAKQRRAAISRAAREKKAADEAKFAEERKERRRKMLNFDDQEILEIDSDDDDSDNDAEQEVPQLKQEAISEAAEEEEDYSEELDGASMIPVDKYCPIPIVIQTDNYPYLLAPVSPDKYEELLKEYDGNIVTLLDEPLMPVYSLSQVIDKIKETFKELENPFDEENEVVVRFKEFDMSIPETCIHAQEVLLCEIYESFNSLCKAKGSNAPKSLCLELSEQKSFITKLEEIRKLSETEGEIMEDILDIVSNIPEAADEGEEKLVLEKVVVEETEEIVTVTTETLTVPEGEIPTTMGEKKEEEDEKTDAEAEEEFVETEDAKQELVNDTPSQSDEKQEENENENEEEQEKEEKEEKEETAEKEEKEEIEALREKEETEQIQDDVPLEETTESVTTTITTALPIPHEDETMTDVPMTDAPESQAPETEAPLMNAPVTVPEETETADTVETVNVTVTETDSTSVDITKETSVPGDELDQAIHGSDSEGSHMEEFVNALDSTKRAFPETEETGQDVKRQKE